MAKLPSKTEIKKILQSCVFDPREPGPMRVIADIGNPEYYRLRAIEEIQSRNIKQAIALLTLYINHMESKSS